MFGIQLTKVNILYILIIAKYFHLARGGGGGGNIPFPVSYKFDSKNIMLGTQFRSISFLREKMNDKLINID